MLIFVMLIMGGIGINKVFMGDKKLSGKKRGGGGGGGEGKIFFKCPIPTSPPLHQRQYYLLSSIPLQNNACTAGYLLGVWK